MEIKLGMKITSQDVNKVLCSGTVIKILDNTIIIEKKTERFVLRKSDLAKIGYTFPRYKKRGDFNHLV